MNAAVLRADDSCVVTLRDGGGTAVFATPARATVIAQDGERAHVVVAGFAGVPGAVGPTGAGLQLSGSVPTYTALPTTLDASNTGDAWLTNDSGRVYVWSGAAWPAKDAAPLLQGPAGKDGAPGQIRFTGTGMPGTIVGASPGDTYLDVLTGTVYTLT